MNEPIFQVDAFTNKPFGGNPACVVLLGDKKSDNWMMSVAREMNLSETAFIIGGKSGGVVSLVIVGCLLAVQLFNAIDWGRGVS